MEPIAAVLLFGASAFMAFFLGNTCRQTTKEQKERAAKLAEQEQKLKTEVLEVSLRVSRICPHNEVAHTLVIEAAQCLNPGGSGFIMDEEFDKALQRYQQAFESLDRARKLAED